jgi:hypothetical protein
MSGIQPELGRLKTMESTQATIRVKFGILEIEYQGDAAFLQEDLVRTVKELLDLQQHLPITVASPQAPNESPAPAASSPGSYEHSTSTIATLLSANSGPELAKAAAAHLYFAKGSKTFSRQELIDAMRSAPAYFKETFVNNLTATLKRLTRDDLLRIVGNDSFSLSAKAIAEIEPKLA